VRGISGDSRRAQFIKSPIEATVSAVKVKNVGIKGVLLETLGKKGLGKL
jgi:hypothetical protein